MAAGNAKSSKSTILRENRGLWTVYWRSLNWHKTRHKCSTVVTEYFQKVALSPAWWTSCLFNLKIAYNVFSQPGTKLPNGVKNRQAKSPPLLPPPQSTARLAYCCFTSSFLAYYPTAVPGPRLLLIPYREQLKYWSQLIVFLNGRFIMSFPTFSGEKALLCLINIKTLLKHWECSVTISFEIRLE